MAPLVGLAPYPNFFDPPKKKKGIKVRTRACTQQCRPGRARAP